MHVHDGSCLFFSAQRLAIGGVNLFRVCVSYFIDENRFMNDSLMLQSIACLPLSHTSLPGWNLASENEHSLSWTRNTMLQSTRVGNPIASSETMLRNPRSMSILL